jgi:hypothetical protein
MVAFEHRCRRGWVDTYFTTFIFGFLGSLAVEVINLYQIYQVATVNSPKTRILPARYRRAGFWIIRFLVAVIAGGLAVAHGIDKPLLAINIGAATPLLVQALAAKYEGGKCH